jgi:hypothetical protein
MPKTGTLTKAHIIKNIAEAIGFTRIKTIETTEIMLELIKSAGSSLMGRVLNDSMTMRAIAANEPLVQQQADLVYITSPIMLQIKKLGIVRIGYATENIKEIVTKMVKTVNRDMDQGLAPVIRKIVLVAVIAVIVSIGITLFFVSKLLLPVGNWCWERRMSLKETWLTR